MTKISLLIALLCCLLAPGSACCDDRPHAAEGNKKKTQLGQYLADYPAAESFCPPIYTTFQEVTQSVRVVNGRRIRQKLNGGYGLPVVDKVDGKNLIHVGADLGWQQVGAPVFAVANGIVRVSEGPKFDPRKRRTEPLRVKPGTVWLPWGNVVAIEHYLGEGRYVTTVYGHLGPRREVKVGDVVQAGQRIGEIGRQHPKINGGYKPHLHFGVREGRAAGKGVVLFQLVINGNKSAVTIAGTHAEADELIVEGEALLRLESMTLNGVPHAIRQVDGKHVMDAKLLWTYQPPHFALIGYELSTDHWLDPVRFLRMHRADTQPAPYRR